VLIEKIPGVPDGIRVDEKGNLWIAAKVVYCYSPQGKLLGTVELDATPTNLAFGGAELDTLYITTHNVLYRVKLGVKGAPAY
jgi:gluconolactonase